MNTTHTPGPWIIRHLIGFPLMIATQPDVDGFGEPIADTSRHMLPAQAQANARLIAAAPDLLAALEASTIALQDFQREAGGIGTHPKLDWQIVENLEVLNKAKGIPT